MHFRGTEDIRCPSQTYGQAKTVQGQKGGLLLSKQQQHTHRAAIATTSGELARVRWPGTRMWWSPAEERDPKLTQARNVSGGCCFSTSLWSWFITPGRFRLRQVSSGFHFIRNASCVAPTLSPIWLYQPSPSSSEVVSFWPQNWSWLDVLGRWITLHLTVRWGVQKHTRGGRVPLLSLGLSWGFFLQLRSYILDSVKLFCDKIKLNWIEPAPHTLPSASLLCWEWTTTQITRLLSIDWCRKGYRWAWQNGMFDMSGHWDHTSLEKSEKWTK